MNNYSLILGFGAILLAVLSPASGNSFTQSGDIIVSSKGGVIKCDQIVCPKNSAYCVASKVSDPENAKSVIRTNQCFSSSNAVTASVVKKEANPNPGTKVNIQVRGDNNSGGGGNFNFNFNSMFNYPINYPNNYPWIRM